MPTPVNSTLASASGKSTFQLKASIWSMRVRGNVQRNHMNTNTIASTLRELRAMTEQEKQNREIPMPAVLIVGDVVGLRQELKWFE